MKYLSLRSLGTAVLMAVAFCGTARADWATSSDALVVKARPADLSIQAQNPPAFAWPRHSTSPASYVLEIRSGTTVVRTYTATRNWYLPAQALPNGTYSWRVRPATLTDWSSDRSFVISNASAKFEVPDDTAMLTRIGARARPRGLQAGLPLFRDWPSAMRTERAMYVTRLSNDVVRLTTELVPVKDADWPLVTGRLQTAENVAQTSAIRTAINKVTRQLDSAALLYRLTKEDRYLTEAKRRGDEIAALSPTGPTSYANQDQATRAISLSLMKAVDMLDGDLDATRRAYWLNIVRVRGEDIYNAMTLSKNDMDQFPLDSHGGTNVGFLSLTAALAVGEFPEAEKWFRFSYRFYVATLSPWGGPEGGFANGTAYAEYTVALSLELWQPLAHITGVNLLEKPWSKGLLRFFMQFMPPGSKTHLFGDAHETAPEMKFMKALALRYATPEAAWYSRNLTGTEDPLTYLQGPYPMPANTITTPVPPANSALFQTIGWAAFHSNMADANRTSVYFKSSAYGSFNHSHGDQNTFVLKKGGVGLLTESGWYDWYDSPNWNNWYRQTKAHNGITFDGGIGQAITGYRETLANNGGIVSYGEYGNTYYVAGMAPKAYGGALTKATRRLWYLRNSDSVVIQDDVGSLTARKFEWNFQTLAPIVVNGDGTVSVTNAGKSVCIRPVSKDLRFEKRPGGLVLSGNYEEHGTYVKTAAATSTEFIVVLDVGCKNVPIQLVDTTSGRSLKVGVDTVTIPR